MIRLSDLTPEHVGRAVVYREPHGVLRAQDGVITSWNEIFVFVRYGVQLHSKATNPMDLTLLSDAKGRT